LNFAFWVSHVPKIEIWKAFFLGLMDWDKIEKDGREVFRAPNRQKKIEMLVFLLGIVFGLVLCLGLF